MRRTDTTAMRIFQLPPPAAAVLDFSNLTHIAITIPSDSKWHMPYHWHSKKLDGKSIRLVQGRLQISVIYVQEDGRIGSYDHFLTGKGHTTFKITEHVMWKPDVAAISDDASPLQVEYEANSTLHRNICSAILDRDLYPKLNSTPVWVKAIFALLSCTPGAKRWLLEKLLRVQLAMIYHRHDFHIHYGSVWFQLPWLLLSWGHERPPRWTQVAHIWSIYVISKVAMLSMYWFGRLMLGLKGEYPEYTPR